MATANPYQVPRSNLDRHEQGDYSEVKVLSTKGRIGRLRYLAYSMGYGMLVYFIFAALGVGLAAMSMPKEAVFGVLGIGYVLLFIFTIMLTIQRAHDFNTTGWITLLSVVPLVGFIFLFIPGTDGENRFGKKTPPNPRGMIWWILIPIIAITGIIAALAIPAYQGYVEKAKAAAGNSVLAPASQPE